MSIVHLRQIQASLEKQFGEIVDLSDVPKASEDDKKSLRLTRALAAYALVIVAQREPHEALSWVIDGFDDNGIDAALYDEAEKRLWLVQSKWHHKDQGSIDQASVLKFVKGVEYFLNGERDRFNARAHAIWDKIVEGLDSSDTKIEFVLAHSGSQGISSSAKQPLDDLCVELNNPTAIAGIRIISQKELHESIAGTLEGTPINADVMLQNWGQLKEPYQAFYGRINARELAEWYIQHGDRLFTKNLRKLISDSAINDQIVNTLLQAPEHFWYFNNGVTVLCQRVSKTLLGGGDTSQGVFTCEGMSVVNGAQTVGSVARACESQPDLLSKAAVMVRFISLENCPDGFGIEVTRATNTQNRVENRDFAALDPEQERLRRELAFLEKAYAYKTGEPTPLPDLGCSIEEATGALACALLDVQYAVRVKSGIGVFWENIERPPYRLLFNSGLTGLRMWHVVQLSRSIESRLRSIRDESKDKRRAIAVHGNRFVAHQVLKRLKLIDLDNLEAPMADLMHHASRMTEPVLDAVLQIVKSDFASAYIPPLFKNMTKCGQIDRALPRDFSS